MLPALKKSLPVAAADYLRLEIDSGRLSGMLPGERRLCTLLNISRGTLRSALRILQERKVVAPDPGIGTRIQSTFRSSVIRSNSVGIVSPFPLETTRLSYALLLDKLRELLQPAGFEIARHYGSSFFTKNPQRALARLAKASAHRCWILFRSTERMQTWFSNSKLPCLVVGSCFPGITLPFVAIDHRALGGHAAALIMRHGHRRIALLRRKSEGPSLSQSREALVEQCRLAHDSGVAAGVYEHDNTAQGLSQLVCRLMASPERPTALVVENPHQYLTVQTTLQALRLAIPDDVSLLSRSDEPFMEFLHPTPVRYGWNLQLLARKIARAADCFANDQTPDPRAMHVMPQLLAGRSLGPPSPAGLRPAAPPAKKRENRRIQYVALTPKV